MMILLVASVIRFIICDIYMYIINLTHYLAQIKGHVLVRVKTNQLANLQTTFVSKKYFFSSRLHTLQTLMTYMISRLEIFQNNNVIRAAINISMSWENHPSMHPLKRN